MTDSPRLTPQVIDRLTAFSDPWLSCDDCFEQVDVVTDALLHAGTPLPEPFRVHLIRAPSAMKKPSP